MVILWHYGKDLLERNISADKRAFDNAGGSMAEGQQGAELGQSVIPVFCGAASGCDVCGRISVQPLQIQHFFRIPLRRCQRAGIKPGNMGVVPHRPRSTEQQTPGCRQHCPEPHRIQCICIHRVPQPGRGIR